MVLTAALPATSGERAASSATSAGSHCARGRTPSAAMLAAELLPELLGVGTLGKAEDDVIRI
jgi:hypothetical protein